MKNTPRPSHKLATFVDDEEHPHRPSDPSWFLDPANEDRRDSLASRYRRARYSAYSLQPAAADSQAEYWEPRDWIEAKPCPNSTGFQGRLSENSPRTKSGSTGSPVQRGLPVTFVLAAAIAALSGATAGLLNAKIEPIARSLFATATRPTAPAPATGSAAATEQPQPADVTAKGKKLIAIATLDVSDVVGETNSLIPLALKAEPALDNQELILKISGLPDKAYLTSGRKTNKVWTLRPDDLKDLKLVMPDDSSRQVDVNVAAVERSTGTLAAPVKSMMIELSDARIQPASAPPPQFDGSVAVKFTPEAQLPSIPRPTAIGTAERAGLEAAKRKVALGDSLVEKIRLTLARKAYSEAWELGSADGALGYARSYDPNFLQSKGIKQAHANIAIALLWYERAAAAGKLEARTAIARLKQ